MFCIHCKYTSFDYLPSCPRCGREWTQEKKALNLDWLVASAPEGKHQRQVSPKEPEFSFSGDTTGSWSAPAQAKPETNQSAAPISRSPSLSQDGETLRAQEGPSDHNQAYTPNDPDLTENELDFPELDELLQPQNPSDPRQAPSKLATYQATDRPGPEDQAKSSQPPEQENQDEESLDLSSLVYDLGLDLDEPDDGQPRQDQPESSQSTEKKYPPSG
ncbi:MAG: hypothetical protein U5L00_05830 [Desulfovermiculus sp.]|nr:hypothetical protein [Desulfovermiculus sp.]